MDFARIAARVANLEPDVAVKKPRLVPPDGEGLDGKPFDDRGFQYDLTALCREARRGGYTSKALISCIQDIWDAEVENFWNDPATAPKDWKGSGF